MRTILAATMAIAAILPASARATDYLYTFSGVVTYANNFDATYIYANEGDPIAFSLRVKDTLPGVAYSYGPNSSSAFGGPDYVPGSVFPIDRKVAIDPALGWASDFAPLENGFRTDEDYSAAITKDLATKTLTIDFSFERYTPPYDGCTERCSGTRETHTASAEVSSDAFASPDFRETGTFALNPGSLGRLGDSYSTYLSFGDSYDIALSSLTVTKLPGAVPEIATWAMMIAGLGFAGMALRRSQGRGEPSGGFRPSAA